MAEISVDRIIQRRDVDAAIYLLRRMLSLGDDCVGNRRAYLASLANKLENSPKIDETEKELIVTAYREVVG